ncbi:helix-turn-helix domain-containing protein [Desulfovibrio sp. OttesenSCG-928-G15]|nr:helix-turn-helix domain-containing protein [Desulfovibrio sp. OttesenSCG-928-G15]
METFAPRGKIYGPILPQFILEKPVTLGAKIMYALLCNYASEKDHCWPSHATLAARLSCSVSSVKNYLAELVREKLISIRREQYRASVYYMLRPAELTAQETKNDRAQSNSDGTQPKSDYLNNLSKQSKEENPPLPPTKPEAPRTSLQAAPVSEPPAAGGVSVSLFDFEKAWELYPKKDAKGFARVAWLKLQRSGQLPPLAEIQAAIERFAASESWQRDNGRFVPQLGNWLRGQRWLDPLSPTEEKERQRREELSRSLRAQEEQEKRQQEQRNAERARLRPHFDAFAANFGTSFNDAQVAMAFGSWLHLHSRGLAPLASDVPADNAQGIMDFMNAFKRKREEAHYLASHPQQPDRLDARSAKLKPCGEILRHLPVFSQLLSGTEQLRQAV